MSRRGYVTAPQVHPNASHYEWSVGEVDDYIKTHIPKSTMTMSLCSSFERYMIFSGFKSLTKKSVQVGEDEQVDIPMNDIMFMQVLDAL
jgi:hypothetical protein